MSTTSRAARHALADAEAALSVITLPPEWSGPAARTAADDLARMQRTREIVLGEVAVDIDTASSLLDEASAAGVEV